MLNVAAVNGTEAAIVAQDLGKASNNITLADQFYTDGTAWCVSVTNAQGDKAKVRPEATSTPLPAVLRPVFAQRLPG